MMTRILFTAAVALLSITMAACGIKPSKVDPPPGAEDVVYPSSYPDPATDPQ